jgi:hypothetical protein
VFAALREACADSIRKPPVYAAISIVLFVKKTTPYINIYGTAVFTVPQLLYHLKI